MRIVLVVALLLALGAGIYFFLRWDRRALDLDAEGHLGKVAVLRNGTARAHKIEGAPGSGRALESGEGWVELAEGTPVELGSVVATDDKGEVKIETEGGWTLLISGGPVYLLDARKGDESVKERYLKVYVEQGSLRAKAHDYHPDEQTLEVRSPRATVRLREGQIGFRVVEGGAGQSWLVSGEATLEREGAEGVRMEPKKVEEL